MKNYLEKKRIELLTELQNPTEKEYMIDYLGADGLAALIYDVILAPLGW